jgi:hypothetical protein
MNFFTVSGVAATRRSPSAVSFRTAIFIPPPLVAQPEISSTTISVMIAAAMVPPLHHADEEAVSARVRLHLLVVVDVGSHVSPR